MDCEVVRSKVPSFATSRLGWAYRARKAFQLAFFPMYQSLGDDALFLQDIEFGADANMNGASVIGWTNKNFLLKDSDINKVGGEFFEQVCSPVGFIFTNLETAYLRSVSHLWLLATALLRLPSAIRGPLLVT